MSNPAFIIEGFMEMKILQNICQKSIPIRRLDCNSIYVTIEKMAEKIIGKINTLRDKYYPIIVVVDREDRDICYKAMAEKLYDYIMKNKNMKNQDIRIAVADRMTENWILADLKCKDTSNLFPQQTDGIDGKSFITKHINKNYRETSDGVDYFKNAKAQNIFQHSDSFKYFFEQVKDLDCDFFKNQNN